MVSGRGPPVFVRAHESDRSALSGGTAAVRRQRAIGRLADRNELA
jgi:hypothetical protein